MRYHWNTGHLRYETMRRNGRHQREMPHSSQHDPARGIVMAAAIGAACWLALALWWVMR
jgi:hypothetical protein